MCNTKPLVCNSKPLCAIPNHLCAVPTPLALCAIPNHLCAVPTPLALCAIPNHLCAIPTPLALCAIPNHLCAIPTPWPCVQFQTTSVQFQPPGPVCYSKDHLCAIPTPWPCVLFQKPPLCNSNLLALCAIPNHPRAIPTPLALCAVLSHLCALPPPSPPPPPPLAGPVCNSIPLCGIQTPLDMCSIPSPPVCKCKPHVCNSKPPGVQFQPQCSISNPVCNAKPSAMPPMCNCKPLMCYSKPRCAIPNHLCAIANILCVIPNHLCDCVDSVSSNKLPSGETGGWACVEVHGETYREASPARRWVAVDTIDHSGPLLHFAGRLDAQQVRRLHRLCTCLCSGLTCVQTEYSSWTLHVTLCRTSPRKSLLEDREDKVVCLEKIGILCPVILSFKFYWILTCIYPVSLGFELISFGVVSVLCVHLSVLCLGRWIVYVCSLKHLLQFPLTRTLTSN